MLIAPYPTYITNLFEKHNSSVEQLPVLDLAGRVADCIDFLQPEDMSSPVMRFVDSLNRPGIALRIVGRATSERTYTSWGEEKKLSQLDSVITIFRRFNDTRTLWLTGGGDAIKKFYDDRHTSSGDHTGDEFSLCDNCPIPGDSPEPIRRNVLLTLLTGTDPDFQLGPDPDFKLFAKQPDSEEDFTPLEENEDIKKEKVDDCALRGRCLGLTLVTPILQIALTIANIVYRLLRLVFLVNLWINPSEPWKDRCLNMAADLGRVVVSPLVIIGLELVALYGIFKPEVGHSLYKSLEEKVYGRALLSSL